MAENKGPGEISRRKFLSIFTGAAVIAAVAAVATPLIGYFLNPVYAKQARKTAVPLAHTSEVPVGVPTFFAYEEGVSDGWVTTTVSKGAWIVNKGGNEFIVYDPRCTHLGCQYYWDPVKQIFQCPCHGGQFDINGKVLAGPPPRPLDRLLFTITENTIEVTTT